MENTERPAPFVLISSNHGTMIINRNDYRLKNTGVYGGVGYQIMADSCYDQTEVHVALRLLRLRRRYYGDGVVAIDCGANIGVHTIEWARLMYNWGHVIAFEAQEKIFYALAGNVVINNCLNAQVRLAAVGACISEIEIPEPNYFLPGSYGAFEIKKRLNNQFIGQQIDYDRPKSKIPQITLDSLLRPRIDMLKIDVEGMEEEVLTGATEVIQRGKPVMIIEFIKSNKSNLETLLDGYGYTIFNMGVNILAIHKSDLVLKHIHAADGSLKVHLSEDT